MKDCLIIGMAIGFIAGAILVQSNKEARELIKQSKDAVQQKIEDIKENIENK